MSFFSQRARGCARTCGRWFAAGVALPLAIISLSLIVGFCGLRSRARWAELYTCAPSFRQADRNRLLRRRRAMLSFAHMVHFLSHEFSGLGAGRFSFAGIFTRTLDGFFFRHD